MFTGIVQSLCPVAAIEDAPGLRRLSVKLGALAEGVLDGASVAINGTCLTVTGVSDGVVHFDVIAETLRLTNLGELRPGSLVNVERSFRVGDEVGGHILSGHVSGVAHLERIDQGDNERNLHFSVPAELVKYLSKKGFVALDGASLTIATVDRKHTAISVCLIPETIARTTLGRIEVGARVNLEVDAQTQSVVDTVERLLQDPEYRASLVRSVA
ncbi:MAG: riboflavin synthase subunit alpha [Pseudomonadales bacterium]